MTLARTTQLIAGLQWRRFLNRMRFGLPWGKRKPGQRTGTGRKGAGSIVLMLFLALVFVFQTINLSGLFLRSVSLALGPLRDTHGRIEIGSSTYRELEKLKAQPPGSAYAREKSVFSAFQKEAVGTDADQRAAMLQALQRQHRERGLDGFVVSEVGEDDVYFLPALRAWRHPEVRPTLLKAIGALLLLVAVTRFFMTLGSANQDLGKVEWSTEWFFTLPVPAGHLFSAQILGHALVDPFSWFVTLPFLFTVFYSASLGLWSLPAALCGMLYLGLAMAALRVVAETGLRKRLAPAQLKNLQALFSVIGSVLMMFLYFLMLKGAPVEWLVSMAHKGPMLLVMNPFSLPSWSCAMASAPVVLLQMAGAVAFVWAGAGCCVELVRDGLVTASGAYIGKRGATPSAAPARRSLLPSGIIGKDLRLLLRDRNLFVKTLVLPLPICGLQFINDGFAHFISSNFQAAAAFAYGLGAYVLVGTALSILLIEGNSLWMLYALPVALHRVMLRKTLLWAWCGLVYTVTALAVCGVMIRSFHPVDIVYGVMACAGVFIYAFIAAGIGMLGTDPLETEVNRRVRPGTVYLFMLLATMFGYAIYAPSMWARVGQLVLSSLLAYALWQKVRDRSQFLLDPVSAPPPQISLADGLIAALAFFVLQGVVSLIALRFKMAMGPALTIAFSIAGALVVLFVFLSYWRTPWVFKSQRPGGARPVGFSIAYGVLLGVAGSGLGLLYLLAVERLPFLQKLIDQASPLQDVHGWWLVLLAVVAAPLFEEFIFRGLIFRGMRRSLPLAISIFGSAAIFALVHPPVSVIPVFLMASLAAWSLERSGRLVTPIAVHMTYNFIVVFISRFIP